VIGDRSVAKQPREQSKSVIGQGRIDERLLPVESLCRAAAWETISVKFALDDFREKLCDCSQSEPASPVPAIQRLPEHKLSAVGVIAQVQPVVDFTPVLGALCDGRARRPRVDTTDHDVHSVQSAVRIQALRNAPPVQAPEQIQAIGEDDGLVKTYLGPAERLAYAVRRRDDIWIEQSDVDAFRVSIFQQCPMQIRQPRCNRDSVAAASHN
jgi:hypothetical protein